MNQKLNTATQPVIMVVDDEPANLQVIRMVTLHEKLDCQLVLLDNGSDALQYLENHAVDLIVSDVVMPSMSGFDLFGRLQEKPEWRDIPVIFLSAINEPDYITRGLELGAFDYIGKPIIPTVLVARLKAVLRLRHLRLELVKRNNELEDLNRLKDEFISICSHDLRSPLSAIDLICQFLGEALQGKSAYQPDLLVKRIINQSHLARRLVDNLLDLNKIEEGHMIPSPSFIGILDLITECLEDEMPIFQAKNLKLVQDLPPDNLICFADREMLGQVMHNLLGNAIKFAKSEVFVGAQWADNQLILTIADDGPGISTAQKDIIFQKYARAHLSHQGQGLGLYISQQITRLHNGKIGVVERPPYATTLEVRLPLAYQREDLPDLYPFAEQHVSILTRSRQTAQTLETLLLQAGLVHVQTLVATDPATDQMFDPPPQLAILDLQNPPFDYFHLVKNINAGVWPTQWVCLGSAEQKEELALLIHQPLHRLTAPPIPLECLQLIHRLLTTPSESAS